MADDTAARPRRRMGAGGRPTPPETARIVDPPEELRAGPVYLEDGRAAG